ncbi:leucine-rich repeat-containing protein 71-like [Gigantopelta aegis]|uniref:leucine-rich repeat-containing protein 71-like n=1 Tax=Gigantopelta aegis TaxID=1735272 RepID=UPI001B88E446|nr:leucine-rich repeat-containing protein 71-like [Gigantopelta aegis]
MNSPRLNKKQEKLNSKDKPYVCCGNFHTDFKELCRRNDMAVIPPVVPRASLPCVSKQEKVKKKAKHHSQLRVKLQGEVAGENSESAEPPPKTYTVKDSFQYFKPTVQVQMDNPDKQDTVTEVYIRGWKIDNLMMNVFRQCWPVLEKLQTINLWNTGLTGEVISIFAEFLPLCSNIKTLILDGNSTKEENWHELIGVKSPVYILSLRNCSITDKGAEGIGQALGSIKSINTKLLALNLSGNNITDCGCGLLARSLRLNRTLALLSLASNQIGDIGCVKLATVLQPFPLEHEEVVERRKQLSIKIQPRKSIKFTDQVVCTPVTKHYFKRVKQRKDKEDDRKISVRKEDRYSKTDKRKESQPLNFDPKPIRTRRASSAGLVGSSLKTGMKDRKAQHYPDASHAHKSVIYTNGQLWVPGNRVLHSVNLSRNLITDVGVTALLNTVYCQTPGPVVNERLGTGLLMLDLHKNDIPPDHELIMQLDKLLALKGNPLH